MTDTVILSVSLCVCLYSQDYTSSMEQQKATLDRVNREYAELKMKRDELTHQRKCVSKYSCTCTYSTSTHTHSLTHYTALLSSRELWRTEAKVDQTIQDTRIELTKYERHLRGSMGKV